MLGNGPPLDARSSGSCLDAEPYMEHHHDLYETQLSGGRSLVKEIVGPVKPVTDVSDTNRDNAEIANEESLERISHPIARVMTGAAEKLAHTTLDDSHAMKQ